MESTKKRPRSGSVAASDGEALQNDVEYAAVDEHLGDEEKERYREVLEAMSRFEERGTYVAEEEGEGEEGGGKVAESGKDAANGAAAADEVEKNGVNKEEGPPKKKSRRQKKEEARGHIARLKALAANPEMVDAWDVSAADPLLLVALKSWPNTVAVPGNWRQKRKYLQNKRGMEKRPFVLPSYIADTGVGGLRDAQIEADAKKTLKQKAREKMRAKTGRGVEIDEVVLRDAFFKFQTKPRLTGPGDLYYELREMEVDASRFRPGVMSAALRAALGIGPDDPPPWLVNMQRYGPPPGYPGLKIPGLNCPIPRGAAFGYHPGGWGKPPVDMSGRPIYGDVFGEGIEYRTRNAKFDPPIEEKRIIWGEIKKDDIFEKRTVTITPSTVAQAQNEVPVDEPSPPPAPAPVATPVADEDVAPPPPPPPPPPAVAAPLETTADDGRMLATEGGVEGIELRKGVPAGQLYTVLQEKKRAVGTSEMHGSAHAYVIPGADSAARDEAEGDVQQVAKRSKKDAEAKKFKF